MLHERREGGEREREGRERERERERENKRIHMCTTKSDIALQQCQPCHSQELANAHCQQTENASERTNLSQSTTKHGNYIAVYLHQQLWLDRD